MNTPGVATEILRLFHGNTQYARDADGGAVWFDVRLPQGQTGAAELLPSPLPIAKTMQLLGLDAARHSSLYDYFNSNVCLVRDVVFAGADAAAKVVQTSAKRACGHCGGTSRPRSLKVLIAVQPDDMLSVTLLPVAKSSLLLCNGCGTVSYCDTACQHSAWGTHKKACKILKLFRVRVMAAASAGEAALSCLPHHVWMKCMLPNIVSAQGWSLHTRENITLSLSSYLDIEAVRYYMEFRYVRLASSDITHPS